MSQSFSKALRGELYRKQFNWHRFVRFSANTHAMQILSSPPSAISISHIIMFYRCSYICARLDTVHTCIIIIILHLIKYYKDKFRSVGFSFSRDSISICWLHTWYAKWFRGHRCSRAAVGSEIGAKAYIDFFCCQTANVVLAALFSLNI